MRVCRRILHSLPREGADDALRAFFKLRIPRPTIQPQQVARLNGIGGRHSPVVSRAGTGDQFFCIPAGKKQSARAFIYKPVHKYFVQPDGP